MRKFEIVSNAAAGALSESWYHEAGTNFICHREALGSNVGGERLLDLSKIFHPYMDKE